MPFGCLVANCFTLVGKEIRIQQTGLKTDGNETLELVQSNMK